MNNKGIKIIKNAVIGFLALIFIMGFFSKSIINIFLPKVQITFPIQDDYERTLDVEGTVVPKETAKIRLGGDVVIDEFYVGVGERIMTGKPIFKINEDFGISSSEGNIKDLELELEKQRIELEALFSSENEIEFKNFELLEEKYNTQKLEVEKLKVLYDSGAIPYSELEQGEMELKANELNLEILKLQVENKESEKAIKIKEIQNNINKIETEIREIRKKQAYYASIEEDGIYYSEYDGIVMSTSQTDEILSKDTIIVEIALVNRFDTVMFKAVMPEELYNTVDGVKIIELHFDKRNMPEEARVIKVRKLADEGLVEIEAEFSESISNSRVNQKVMGTFIKYFSLDNTIPKDAFIPYDDIEIGEKGVVFIADEVKGILGNEYYVREVPVTLVGVGDTRVSIRGLEGIRKPYVILNLSYKIKDGTKVFLWR